MDDEAINTYLQKLLLVSSGGEDGPGAMAEKAAAAVLVPTHNDRFYMACELGSMDTVQAILSSSKIDVCRRFKDGSNSLIIASQRGHVDVCRLLLAADGSQRHINSQWVGNTNVTPLMIWCQHGNKSIVELLLSSGANPNFADEHGGTALFRAAKYNHHSLLPLLYSYGADVNKGRIDGSTAMLVAVEKGHADVTCSLYDEGASLNVQLEDGCTLMELAAQNNHKPVVEQLIRWKCPVLVANAFNQSPLWVAAARGHDSLLPLLLQGHLDLLFLEDKEHGLNVFEVAHCSAPDSSSTLAALIELSVKSSNVVWPDVKRLVSAALTKDKTTFLQSLGLESQPSTILSNAGPIVVPLPPHEVPLNGKETRDQGNRLFSQQRYTDAIRMYQQAAPLCPDCPLAVSNAAEACLRLCDFVSALEFASRALEIQPNHTKSWFRYVKSLSSLNRAAEALVWIAKREAAGAVDRNSQVDLVQAVGEYSPFVYHMNSSIIVREASEGQFCLVANSTILPQEVLSKEVAVLSWTCNDLYDDKRLEAFAKAVTDEQLGMINGVFPRCWEDVPTESVKSLQTVEHRLKKCIPEASASRRRELSIALARTKLNAFDNGIHHFSSFYNHSCEPNCEVRSISNLEVVANRKIAPNEILCISYLNAAVFSCPVPVRQHRLLHGWGSLCKCTRCLRDAKCDSGATNISHIEAMEKAIMSHLQSTRFCYPPPTLKGADTALADWESCSWKKAMVLNTACSVLRREFLSEVSACMMPSNDAASIIPERATILLKLKRLEEAGATLCFSLQLHEQSQHVPLESVHHYDVYQSFVPYLECLLSAGIKSRVRGYQNSKEMEAKVRQMKAHMNRVSPTS